MTSDFRKERDVAGKPNWHFTELDTGALPLFERLGEVVVSYDRFIESIA